MKPTDFPIVEEDRIFTTVESQMNLSKRWVYCQYCKYKVITAMPGAQCKKCESNLITLLRDKDELA